MEDFHYFIFKEFHLPVQNPVIVFSVFLSVIFLAPLLFRRIKMPGIVGLILSGLAIGPHGFFIIERNNAVELFSTIGLLYLMFLAGLELDLNKFTKTRHKSFVFGFLTFIMPIVIGFPVCFYLMGYGFNASFLIACMFATHTLIAYPIVSRFRISNDEVVSVTVGGTILTDTTVLVILAFITGSYESQSQYLWVKLLISSAVFLSLVFFAIPPLTRFIFSKPDMEKHMHFVFVLMVVFIVAVLARMAGLEPIVGAFAAGLAFNKLIPKNSALMNRIDFIGNSLFIPMFLISIGMFINLKILSSDLYAWIVTITLVLLAIIGKWLPAFLTSVFFGYSRPQRNLIFGLSVSHAASTLAVIAVGYKLGIIDDNILNGTIILILITCLVGSFVTEDSARKILLADNVVFKLKSEEMAQKILVPIANPHKMSSLIDFALTINNHFHKPPIIGVSVVDDDDKAPEKLLESRKMLEEAIMHASASEQKIEIITTIDRNIATGILRVSKELFATEIVLGWSEKNSISDIIFGRIIDEITENSPRTVYIIRINKPLNIYNEIKVFCPPFSEAETGFNKWIDRVFRLASTINKKITFCSTYETYVQIELFANKYNIVIPILHIPFAGWNEIPELNINNNDLAIFASPRRKSIAYHFEVKNTIKRCTRKEPAPSMIIIYPEV